MKTEELEVNSLASWEGNPILLLNTCVPHLLLYPNPQFLEKLYHYRGNAERNSQAWKKRGLERRLSAKLSAHMALSEVWSSGSPH